MDDNKETQKKCFIILPTDDEGCFCDYKKGHFDQVYEQIIKPSILGAGYTPVRRDKIVSGSNAEVEIMKELVSDSLVLFDISIKCGWVLTVLGIRRSYNAPVIVLQDDKSIKALNNEKLNYIEYSHLLTTSTVETTKQKILEKIFALN